MHLLPPSSHASIVAFPSFLAGGAATLAALFALLLFTTAAHARAGKVKVFILAGQSNMEGKGFPEPVAWQVGQPEYRERWTHFIENGDHAAFRARYEASHAADPQSVSISPVPKPFARAIC